MPSIVRPTTPLRPPNARMWQIFGVGRGSKADRQRQNVLPAALMTLGYLCGLLHARLGGQTAPLAHVDVDAPLAIFNVSALSRTAQIFPGSITAAYAATAPACLQTIHIPRLRKAVNLWGQRHPNHAVHDASRDVRLVARSNTLTVQACGKADPHVARAVAHRARHFHDVLIVPMGRHGLGAALMLQRALHSNQRLYMRHPPVTHNDTNVALWIFSHATHVVICPGLYGALIALVTQGVTYATKDSKAFLDHIGITAIMQMPAVDIVADKADFSSPQLARAAMGPVASSCCDFVTMGGGVLCGNARSFAQPPCWVLTIGTTPTLEFERNVIRQSACNVQVFSCGPAIPDVPSNLASRISVRRSCLRAEGGSLTWLNLIEAGAKGAGLARGVAPSFARIDVEVWDFDILMCLISETKDPSLLPEQISVRLHFDPSAQRVVQLNQTGRSKRLPAVSAQNIAMLFSNLSHSGYDLVHRAHVRGFEHCIEITLLHRSVTPSTMLLSNRTAMKVG